MGIVGAASYAAPPPPLPFDPKPTERSPPTLLIVDDDPWLLATAKRSLGEAHRVLTATCAAAAREIWARQPLDGAIVDLQLGSESGLDVLRELRRDHAGVPTALLTAHLAHAVAAGAALAGARVIAQKPTSLRRLVEALRAEASEVRVLESRPRAAPHAAAMASPGDPPPSLDRVMRDWARYVLDRNGGNVARTARELQISRSHLYDLLDDLA